MRRTIRLIDRLLAKTTKTDTCWLWRGCLDRGGYGQIQLGSRDEGHTSTHRASWLAHIGPIPKGSYVCHTCDVRSCVNPDHLFLGTHNDNMDDMFSKGRNSPPPVFYGQSNHANKLTPDEVLEIREALKTCQHGTITALAKQYGVDRKLIHSIKNKTAWKWL